MPLHRSPPALSEESLSSCQVIILRFFMRWSVRCRPRGDTGAAHRDKVHCSHSSERGSRKVPPWGGAWGVFTRAGGDPRARPGGVPLVCSDVTGSQSGEREMGNLWPGPASSHWCTRAPGRGVHSPFGGAVEAAGKEILKFAVQPSDPAVV